MTNRQIGDAVDEDDRYARRKDRQQYLEDINKGGVSEDTRIGVETQEGYELETDNQHVLVSEYPFFSRTCLVILEYTKPYPYTEPKCSAA